MRRSRCAVYVAGLVLLSAMLAGCSSPQELILTIPSLGTAFEPAMLSVRAGQQVRLTIKNDGDNNIEKHNFVLVRGDEEVMRDVTFAVSAAINKVGSASGYLPLEESDLAKILIHTNVIDPGMSETITFAAPQAGTYKFICTVGSHWTYGMIGTLTVAP
jgi:uncharacterized cupredoxin-like copper-binding protein